MPPAPHSAAVRAAEALLRRWIGLDVATIGQSTLERAVRVLMEAAGQRDPQAFVDRLTADTAERDRLVEEIVVAESWFFRDPQVFEVINRFASTRMGLPARRPFRVLCVPCAAGEEPFSVAMSLFDAGLPAPWFTIDAVDISRTGLERAAAATYVANSFRTVDLSFRDRWFRDAGTAWRLDDAVRRSVTFSWGNILDDAFATDRDPYDVIFCRNLLIYLTPEARIQVERVFDRLLRPDGILVLGAAEPPILRGPWIPVGERSSFTLRRGVAARRAEPPPAAGLPSPTVLGEDGIADDRPERQDAPAIVKPLDATAPLPADGNRTASDDDPAAPTATDTVLREAGRLANCGRHAEALRLCERHANESRPAPEVLFMMAMLHQSVGDLDRAESCLHKTLSVDAGHEEALLALALVASRRGDTALAEHYRHSAARAFARKAVR